MRRKLTRLVIVIVISIITALTICYCNRRTQDEVVETLPTPTPTIAPSPTPALELVNGAVELASPLTSDEALELITLEQEYLIIAGELLDRINALGYEDEDINLFAEREVAAHINNLNYYNIEYERLLQEEEAAIWAPRWEEYPVATKVWLYLTEELGYNEYVAAGILGNMMTECGGQSLYLNPSASSGIYYGICQWGSGFPGRYTDLDGQLTLLRDTIEDEFNCYGTMSYTSFCALQSAQDAARAFAGSYERCTRSSYGQRAANATIAYNYFVYG